MGSYAGWLIWCDSWRLFEAYIEPVTPAALWYYVDVIKGDCSLRKRVKALKRYKKKFYTKKGGAAV